MQTKEVFQGKTVTVEDFTKALCALMREHLVGMVQKMEKDGFTFCLPGQTNVFRVGVTMEKAGENP